MIVLNPSDQGCKRKQSRVLSNSILDLRFINIASLTEMQKGKIARLTDRGFGFITQEGEEKDLFFHSNELKNVQYDELREGDELQFEVAEGQKGPNAVNISRADDNDNASTEVEDA